MEMVRTVPTSFVYKVVGRYVPILELNYLCRQLTSFTIYRYYIHMHYTIGFSVSSHRPL